MTISANRFKDFWEDYFKSLKNNLQGIWEDSTNWTKTILYNDSGGLKKHLEIFLNKDFVVCEEKNKIDFAVYLPNNLLEIWTYDNKEKYVLKDFPLKYEILIEHENDFRTCEKEMIKLTHYKSFLKVLITYPEIDSHKEALIKNMDTILKKANDYSYDENTEFLLIMCDKNLKCEYVLFKNNHQFKL